MPLEVLWGMDLSPYYHFALAVICLLTVYIPIFWAAGEAVSYTHLTLPTSDLV